MQAEERIVTVGLTPRSGPKFRVRFNGDHVEFEAVGVPFGFSFTREAWMELVEAGISTWGRTLHTSLPIVGVCKMTALAHGDTLRIPVSDSCDNCGSGFGPDGSAIHVPVSIGVCEIATGPAHGGGPPQ